MRLPLLYSDGHGFKQIGDVARKVLRRKKFYEKGRYGALVDAWSGLVGAAIAARTRIRSFTEGELVVEADSSVLLHELNGFMKQDLLAALQQLDAGRDVAALRFCLGNGSREGAGK